MMRAGRNRSARTATATTENRKTRITRTSFLREGHGVKINPPAHITIPNFMFRFSLSTVKGEETGEY